MAEQILTIDAVARALGVSHYLVRIAIHALGITTERLGSYRVVPRDAVDRIERELQRRGRIPGNPELASNTTGTRT